MRVVTKRACAPRMLVAALAVLPGLMLGCGSNEAKMYPVTGKVTHDGKAVEGGGFTFSPIVEEKTNDAGRRSVIAVVQNNGTFEFDAAEGKYRVTYSPPATETAAPAEGEHVDPSKAPQSPYAGLAPKEQQIEVTSGTNDLTIELVKQP